MKQHFRRYAILTLLAAAMSTTALQAGTVFGNEDPVKRKKERSRAHSSLNNASVKIYPDAIRRAMHVVAKENEGKPIEFFVFDLQGTLVQNHKMSAKDHIRIEGLARGTYVYRVFCGDEETASGNFEIR